MPFTWEDFEQKIKDMTTDEEFEKLQVSSDFSSKLIKARVKMGFTQEELAEHAGLKQSAIARIETKGSLPRIDTVYKLAKALNSKIDFYPIKAEEEKNELAEIKDMFKVLTNEIKILNQNLGKLNKAKIVINVNSHRDSESDFDYNYHPKSFRQQSLYQIFKSLERGRHSLNTSYSSYQARVAKFRALKEG